MSMRDAYFAGLLDGEGAIGQFSHGAGRSRRIVIEINMTHLETIEAIHKHFGVGWVRPKKVYETKPQWRWKCTAKAAISVLKRIQPYMITRREIVNQLLG